jgi:hypothetical protein
MAEDMVNSMTKRISKIGEKLLTASASFHSFIPLTSQVFGM